MQMQRIALYAFAVMGLCVGCSSGSDAPVEGVKPSADNTAPTTTVAYSEIQAIFDKNCVGCHGTDQPKEGYSFVSHESLMKGGEDGPAMVAGDPEKSLIVQVLRGTNGKKQMPFGRDPLPESDIAKFEAWIKVGAKP